MTTSNPPTRRIDVGGGLDVAEVDRVVDLALAEDLRDGPDVTTAACVPAGTVAVGRFRTRLAGTLAGIGVAARVLEKVCGDALEILDARVDGDRLAPGDTALTVRAPLTTLLTAERTALNLLCQLSGVATATAAWVDAAAGTSARIRDSRKTIPGLRVLQKYAVRCGGGVNHRRSLGDAVLIKDNHIHAAGSVTAALTAARAAAGHLPCEVEVDSLDQLDEVLRLAPQLVLLDNFSPDGCAEAVRCRDTLAPSVGLEASGGLSLPSAHAYARSGVDYLSVGGLTHSSPALDLGLDLQT